MSAIQPIIVYRAGQLQRSAMPEGEQKEREASLRRESQALFCTQGKEAKNPVAVEIAIFRAAADVPRFCYPAEKDEDETIAYLRQSVTCRERYGAATRDLGTLDERSFADRVALINASVVGYEAYSTQIQRMQIEHWRAGMLYLDVTQGKFLMLRAMLAHKPSARDAVAPKFVNSVLSSPTIEKPALDALFRMFSSTAARSENRDVHSAVVLYFSGRPTTLSSSTTTTSGATIEVKEQKLTFEQLVALSILPTPLGGGPTLRETKETTLGDDDTRTNEKYSRTVRRRMLIQDLYDTIHTEHVTADHILLLMGTPSYNIGNWNILHRSYMVEGRCTIGYFPNRGFQPSTDKGEALRYANIARVLRAASPLFLGMQESSSAAVRAFESKDAGLGDYTFVSVTKKDGQKTCSADDQVTLMYMSKVFQHKEKIALAMGSKSDGKMAGYFLMTDKRNNPFVVCVAHFAWGDSRTSAGQQLSKSEADKILKNWPKKWAAYPAFICADTNSPVALARLGEEFPFHTDITQRTSMAQQAGVSPFGEGWDSFTPTDGVFFRFGNAMAVPTCLLSAVAKGVYDAVDRDVAKALKFMHGKIHDTNMPVIRAVGRRTLVDFCFNQGLYFEGGNADERRQNVKKFIIDGGFDAFVKRHVESYGDAWKAVVPLCKEPERTERKS